MNCQRANEEFYHTFVEQLENGIVGNCAFAIEEVSRPEVKQTKSALMSNTLRLGDVENHPDEAIEISVKTSKCTALARPKSWKKFARLGDEDEDIIMRNTDDDDEPKAVYGELSMQTQYVYDPNGHHDEDDEDAMDEDDKKPELKEIDKEELIRGYKYGTSYVPVPEDNFPKLATKKGIDICGFFKEKHFRRELAMGEVQYVWADPGAPLQQVALSSIAEAMYEKGVMAIARWVTRDGADPKMGVLKAMADADVDYFLWVQVRAPRAHTRRRTHLYRADALRGRRAAVHLPVAREAGQQEGRARHTAPLPPHGRTNGGNGRLRRRHGPHGRRRRRRRRVSTARLPPPRPLCAPLPPSALFCPLTRAQDPQAVVRHRALVQPRGAPRKAGALPRRGRAGPAPAAARAPAPGAPQVPRAPT